MNNQYKKGDLVYDLTHKSLALIDWIKDRGDGILVAGVHTVNLDDHYTDLLSNFKKIKKEEVMNNEALNEWMKDNTDVNAIQAKVDKAIMTPKEKAKEMYDKMLNSDIMNMTKHCAKHCALIAVYEILNIGCIEVPYWQQVKQEIEKL